MSLKINTNVLVVHSAKSNFTFTIAILLCAQLLLISCSDNKNDFRDDSYLENPKNRTQEYSQSHNDVTIENSYQWIANKEESETLNWVETQYKLTQDYFAEKAYEEFNDAVPSELVSNYWHVQTYSYYYYFVRKNINQDDVTWQLIQYNSITQKLDAIDIEQENIKRIAGLNISPNARYASYQVQHDDDSYGWYLYDFTEGSFLPSVLTKTKTATEWQWLSAYKYLYSSDNQVFWADLSNRVSKQNIVVDNIDLDLNLLEASSLNSLQAKLTHDLQYLVLNTYDNSNKKDYFWVKKLDDDNSKPIVLINKVKARFRFLGNQKNTLYFITNLSASRNRIISINLNKSSRRHWKEVVAQSKDLLIDAKLINNKWLLNYKENTQNKLYIASNNGTNKQLIKTPNFSDTSYSSNNFTGNDGVNKEYSDVLLTISNLGSSSLPYRLNSKKKKIDSVFDLGDKRFISGLDIIIEDIRNQLFFFRSDDGSRIPITLVSKGDVKRNKPVLIIMNDGFGSLIDNQYQSLVADFIGKGGLLAVVHSRGGLAYGSTWHLNGTGSNKVKVVEDLVSAQNWLIDKNYSGKNQLAILASSSNSPLIAQALNHPDSQLDVAIFDNPYFDLINKSKSANTKWADEFGYDNDRATTQNLLELSAFHNIQPHEYPATLIVSKNNSVENLQYLAKLQNYQLAKEPILYLSANKELDIEKKKLFFLLKELKFYR